MATCCYPYFYCEGTDIPKSFVESCTSIKQNRKVFIGPPAPLSLANKTQNRRTQSPDQYYKALKGV